MTNTQNRTAAETIARQFSGSDIPTQRLLAQYLQGEAVLFGRSQSDPVAGAAIRMVLLKVLDLELAMRKYAYLISR